MTPIRHRLRSLALAALLAVAVAPLAAQGLFSPVIRVNDMSITQHELNQRALLLRALNTPGNLDQLAREQLIDDKLKAQAVQAAGISVGPDDIEDGVAEFAGRANLTAEEFLQALTSRGVAPETFRDFVVNSLGWRELVRARFGPRAQVSELEIDRALGEGAQSGGLRVRLAEAVLVARGPQLAQARARAERIAAMTTPGEFSAAARQFSASPSRANGGLLEWLPITNLPPGLRPILLGLKPGEVAGPFELDGAILLFQLRGIEETDYVAPDYAAIEYAQYFIAGGRSETALAQAQRIVNRSNGCDDLYGAAKGQPDEVLTRDTLPPAEIPQDIATELAKLDPGEASTLLTRNDGQTLVLLMLCGRTPEIAADADRDSVRAQLRSRRLASYADGLLAELRADALIRQ